MRGQCSTPREPGLVPDTPNHMPHFSPRSLAFQTFQQQASKSQYDSSCHMGRHRARECWAVWLWGSHSASRFLLQKLRDQGQANPKWTPRLLHPQQTAHQAQTKRPEPRGTPGLRNTRGHSLCRVSHSGPWPPPHRPPNARTGVPAASRGSPGPSLAARKWLLPTLSPASMERGQRSQTGGRRWQGPKGPNHSLPAGQGRWEGSGGKQARDSSLRFSGEGRAPGKGKQGPPWGSAVGEGKVLWPHTPTRWLPPRASSSTHGGPCPPPISGEKVRLCVLPDSCNESHIHSVLCAYWKASLCLLGSL